ncbi:MAG: protein kinase [Planctomycetota bacterium]|nr:protein kinase [Planctomycetota bacterium]
MNETYNIGPSSAPERLGPYQVLGVLGRGAFGVTYRGKDRFSGREVCLKAIDRGRLGEEIPARVHKEFETAGRLTHPGIVHVHSVGEQGKLIYIVMDLVEGPTLQNYLTEQTLTPMEIATLFHQIADAVGSAHALGVIHRDLKPANVLVDPDVGPRVTDFGLARDLHDRERITQTRASLGTPSYMAPEVASGSSREAGPAADVHSLGVMFYEALVGIRPFDRANTLATAHAVAWQPPEPPSRYDPKLSRDIERVVMKCLEKDPGRRYPDANALAQDLDRFLLGEPVEAAAAGPISKLFFQLRRHRKPLAVVSFILGIGVLFTLFLGVQAALQKRKAHLKEQKRAAREEGRQLIQDRLRQARLWIGGGRESEAITVLKEAIDWPGWDPEVDNLKVDAFLLLSGCQARAGDLEAARVTLERLLELKPEDPEALIHLARLSHGVGRDREGLEFLDRLSDQAAETRTAILLRVQIQMRMGQARSAWTIIQKGVSEFPGDLEFRKWRLWTSLEVLERSVPEPPLLESSRSDLEAWRAEEGESIPVLLARARLLALEDAVPEALDELARLIRRHPKLGEAYFWRAWIRLRSAFDPVAARSDFRQAYRLGFDPRRTRIGSAIAGVLSGDIEGAKSDLEQSRSRTSDAHWARVLLGVATGKQLEIASGLRLLLESDPGHLEARVLQAHRWFNEKKVKEAGELFAEVLAQETRHVGALAGLCATEMSLGRLAQAEFRVSMLERLDPHGAAGVVLRARLSGLQGVVQENQGLGRLENAKLSGLDEVLLKLAREEKARGKLESALPILRILVSRQPLDPRQHRRLARMLLKLSRRREAGHHCRVAILLDPVAAQGYQLAGDIALEAGRFDDAVEFYTQALSQSPGNRSLRMQRARALLGNGAITEALEEAGRLVEENVKDAQGYRLRAEILRIAGRVEEARSDREHAQELAHSEANRRAKPLLDEAIGLSQVGDLSRALRLIDQAVTRYPGSGRAYYLRGTVKLKQFLISGNLALLSGGLLDLVHSFRIDPRLGTQQILSFERQSLLLDSPQVLDEIRRVLNEGRRDADVYCLLGYFYASRAEQKEGAKRTWHYDRAKGYFDQALALEPGFAVVYYCRGLVEIRMGNLEAARMDFQRVLDLSPRMGLGVFGFATLAAVKGDASVAAKHLSVFLDLGYDPCDIVEKREDFAKVRSSESVRKALSRCSEHR